MLITENGNNYFALKKEDKTTSNSPTNTLEKAEKESLNNNDAELLEDVKKYMKENNAISASRIQGKFGVGYPKAQKIMRQLIEEGLVELSKDDKYIIKDKNNISTCSSNKSCKKEKAILNRVKKFLTNKDMVFICNIQAKFSVGYVKAKEIITKLIDEGFLEVNPNGGYNIIK